MQSFNLVRWFAALSFATIALISIASSVFLARFLTDTMLAQDAKVMTAFLNDIVDVEGADAFFLRDGDPTVGGDIAEFFVHLGNMPDMLRANVYLRDGTIVWSSDPDLIGRRFDDNRELELAFRGRPKIAMGVVGEKEKAEHAFFHQLGLRFVENYLPIFGSDPVDPAIIGVVEVYRSPQALFERIEAGRERIWLSAIGAGAFLYLTLFWIVRRANGVIAEQQRLLVETKMLATVGEMASTVAHGLRNPLASIRSSAELALEYPADREVQHLLEDIMIQSDRLESWVRQYLSETEPEGRESRTVDVAAIVSRSLESFATELQRRAIRHSVRLDAALPPAPLNPLVLTQILNSLIANAVEAMPAGGDLGVEAAGLPGGGITIRVTDSGRGMSPDEIETAFGPFFTSKNAGLGLGLPLADRIVTRHGGTLTLGSVEGRGTAARITLPAAG